MGEILKSGFTDSPSKAEKAIRSKGFDVVIVESEDDEEHFLLYVNPKYEEIFVRLNLEETEASNVKFLVFRAKNTFTEVLNFLRAYMDVAEPVEL